MTDTSDLIDRVKTGQRGAFEELYHAHVDEVHRKLAKLVGADSELEDLVQLTFVQVYEKIDSFRGDSKFSTWLHRVAINVALGYLRKRKHWYRPQTDESAPLLLQGSEAYSADSAADARDQLNRLHKLLNTLKPKKRLVYVLIEVEGYSLEEVAHLVDAPKFTVATRLRTARGEIRRGLLRQPPLRQPRTQAAEVA